ncbi:hypothetical protein JCM11251_007528 [Rhodosporidiobolus azoricus]
MVAIASPSAPSAFDKLPLELIKHIVEVVHVQDVSFKDLGIGRADYRHHKRPELAPNADREARRLYEDNLITWERLSQESRTNPLSGRWSCWLGRGTAALSLVNKQLRSLTREYVFETATVRQLAEFSLLEKGTEIRRLVKHLFLRKGDSAQYSSVARLHPQFPITRLTICRQSLPFMFPDIYDGMTVTDEGGRTAKGLLKLIGRVSSVEMRTVTAEEVEGLMEHLDLPSIRELKIIHPVFDVDEPPFRWSRPNPRLLQFFQRLSSLEQLVIEDSEVTSAGRHYEIAETWLTDLSIPSLHTLTLNVGCAAAQLAELAVALAPNIRALHFTDDLDYRPTKVPKIPSLRHFSFTTREEGFVALSNESELVSLAIEDSDLSAIDCCYALPPPHSFPSTLRRITRHARTALPPQDVDFYRAGCAARGVEFRFFWTPDTCSMAPGSVDEEDEEDDEQSSFDPLGTEVARDTIKWAGEALQRAEEIGDQRTVHELVQALMRVRERQAIERL